jgi:hypothetical protein
MVVLPVRDPLLWASATRRRRQLMGRVLRAAAPVLPRRDPPQRPVFVIGAPRSGTTVVFELLDQSPELASLGRESHLLWEMFHPMDERRHRSHRLAEVEPSDRERKVLSWAIGHISRGRRYLDKYPRMSLRVEYLDRLYPDAHFVHVVRDGREVVSSLITGWRTPGRFGLGTRLPVPLEIEGYEGSVWRFLLPPGWEEYAQGRRLEEVCAFQWVEANRAVLEARDRIPPDRWTQVRYESLVGEPVDTARRLAHELGVGTEGIEAWAAGLDRRVTRTAVSTPRRGKWAEEHGAEIARVLPMLDPMMGRLGYDATVDA